jgi:hypothetical protein
MHFSLLWSFFEANALNTHGSSNRILALVHEWSSSGRLHPELFTKSLTNFRNRYFENGEFTHYFEGLHLRRNDSPELVRAVLSGENNDAADCVAAVLIIVFRFRNNLFHGTKWLYEIRGQLDNFNNANAILMAAMETHGQL